MRIRHHAPLRFAQIADHLGEKRCKWAVAGEVVCNLGGHTISRRGRAATNRGECAIQASDTPATRRKKASHGAKPPPPPVWRAPSCFQDRHSAGSREITRPASTKTPNLGCFERAGRTFSRPNETTTAFAHSFTGTHETSNTFARPQCRKNTHFGRAKVMAVSPTHEDRAAKVSPVSSRRSSALDTAPMHQIAHHCTGN